MKLQERSLWTKESVSIATEGHIVSDTMSNDWVAKGVSIDSRTCLPGDIFIALSGTKFDGHNYVSHALDCGAVAAVVSHVPEGLENLPALIVVEDSNQALIDMARYARASSNAKIIGVTGSVGKTTTKDGLTVALSVCGDTHSTLGNLNNHLGTPLTLSRLPNNALYSVIELGMNHSGELGEIAKLSQPDVAVITNIEAVHLENFDSVFGIADAKSEIFAGLGSAGTAVLNRDNIYFAYLSSIAEEYGIDRILSFGADPDSDSRLISMKSSDGGSDVIAEINGQTISYRLNTPGRHQVSNSLAILAVVDCLEADIVSASAALANLSAPLRRGRHYKVTTSKGEFIVIDDSYNASPASMRASFEVLASASTSDSSGRKLAVLSDMLELGPDSRKMHAGLAQYLTTNKIDQVFTAGTLMSELDKALPKYMRGGHRNTPEELLPIVKQSIRDGDVILVKGSLGSRAGPIADALINTYEDESSSFHILDGDTHNVV
jgi:UDP-N-acetylmuramoyl-tripeptide--D-alanyl-D-alanine ligase